jgi:hypothetical protein
MAGRCGSQGSSVSIVAGYGLDRATEVWSPAEVRDLSSKPLCADRLWDPPSLLYNGHRVSFPRGKVQLGRDADPWPRFSLREGPTVQEAGWAPEPVWTQRLHERILSPLPGIEPRSPGRRARSQTLYWLRYLAHAIAILPLTLEQYNFVPSLKGHQDQLSM